MLEKKVREGVLGQTIKKLHPIGFTKPIVNIAEKSHNINAVAKAADVPTNTTLFGQRLASAEQGKAQGRIDKIPSIFGTAHTSYRKTKKKATFKNAQAPYRKAKAKSVSKV